METGLACAGAALAMTTAAAMPTKLCFMTSSGLELVAETGNSPGDYHGDRRPPRVNWVQHCVRRHRRARLRRDLRWQRGLRSAGDPPTVHLRARRAGRSRQGGPVDP